MRLALVIALAACAHRAAAPTVPGGVGAAPAHDLATARSTATPGDARAAAKDPRVVDLDIIRITAHSHGVGSDADVDHVATADLFKQATAEAKAGRTEHAIALFRQLVTEFPDSKFAAVALFDIAAIHDGRGDVDATVATLRELVGKYPQARESIDGELYLAAVQSEHDRWADAAQTLDHLLARGELTYADRVEASARRGYVLIELGRFDDAQRSLDAAIADWRKAPHLDDPYYIAMAHYYRGELAHRKFTAAPVRLPDDQLVADLETKRQLAVAAYDRWKEALAFQQAYWATASGYQMSQIFVELWEVTVKAPYPARVEVTARPRYVTEVHNRVRPHLEKALEGHRMNVELAKAYGVDTRWSKGSEQRAVEIMERLAKDVAGTLVVMPPN